MIRFGFSHLDAEADPQSEQFDLFIDVVAAFELITDAGVIYREAGIPIVELACDLRDWAEDGMRRGQDFEWNSMSTPEPGWVWIRRWEAGYRVGSIHQDEIDPKEYPLEEVQEGIEELWRTLPPAVNSALGLSITRCGRRVLFTWLPRLAWPRRSH